MLVAAADHSVSQMMSSLTCTTGMMSPAVRAAVRSVIEMKVGAVVPDARARLPAFWYSAMPTTGVMALQG